MVCKNCSYHNKKAGTCEICGYVMTIEIEKKVYRIPKKTEKQKKVNEDDIAFFKEIWEKRPHYSEVSGDFLGDEFNVCFFSHILTKGSYPRFRHNKDNIILMSYAEHQEWEFTDRKDQKWTEIRDLSEELVIEYYNPPKI